VDVLGVLAGMGTIHAEKGKKIKFSERLGEGGRGVDSEHHRKLLRTWGQVNQ